MIKLWCCTFADVPAMDPVMEFAEENGAPILFHSFKKSNGQIPNETTGIHVANIARRHPKTKILMAHLGGSACDGIPAIRDLKNVWCDQSGTIYHGEDLIMRSKISVQIAFSTAQTIFIWQISVRYWVRI